MTKKELKELIMECLIEHDKKKELLEREVVNEDLVYAANYKSYNFSMHMDGMISASSNYYKDPYVKIANNTSWAKADSCLLYFFKDHTVSYHVESGIRYDLPYSKNIGNFINAALKAKFINKKTGEPCSGYKYLNYLIAERFPNVNEKEIYKINGKEDYSIFNGYRKQPTKLR